MTFAEYEQSARRTINPELTLEDLKRHALLGLGSEVGEIQGIFQKAYQGHTIDPEKVKDELGDLIWFAAELCFAMGFAMEDVATHNNDKLMRRYPNGFSAERSVHREEYNND